MGSDQISIFRDGTTAHSVISIHASDDVTGIQKERMREPKGTRNKKKTYSEMREREVANDATAEGDRGLTERCDACVTVCIAIGAGQAAQL